MSDRILSKDAEDVLAAAAGIADSWNHHWLGTEHVIVACAKAERDGHIVPRLAAAGLTFEAAEAAVTRAVPPNAEREVPWSGVVHTPRLQKGHGDRRGVVLGGHMAGPSDS